MSDDLTQAEIDDIIDDINDLVNDGDAYMASSDDNLITADDDHGLAVYGIGLGDIAYDNDDFQTAISHFNAANNDAGFAWAHYQQSILDAESAAAKYDEAEDALNALVIQYAG